MSKLSSTRFFHAGRIVALFARRPAGFRRARRASAAGVLELGTHSAKLHIVRVLGRVETRKWPDLGLAHVVYGPTGLAPAGFAELLAAAADRSSAAAVDVRAVLGTAAFREVANGAGTVLRQAIARTFAPSVEVKVVSAEEETANLARGCTEFYPAAALCDAVAVEVGGGSSEIVAFPGGRTSWLAALPVGVHTLAARGVRSGAWSVDDARACLDEALEGGILLRARKLILAGGAARSIARVLGRTKFRSQDLLDLEWTVRCHGAPRSLAAARRQVFLPGLLIVRRLFALTGAERAISIEIPSIGARVVREIARRGDGHGAGGIRPSRAGAERGA